MPLFYIPSLRVRMRDCGEDLLVEISDVLFNELAYFRLMEDLGDSNVTDKKGRAEWVSSCNALPYIIIYDCLI